MSEKEKLEIEINLLLSLDHTEAWTGNLDNLQQKSYVLYSNITKMINEKREEHKRL